MATAYLEDTPVELQGLIVGLDAVGDTLLVVLVDVSGRIVQVSRRFCDLLGLDPSVLLGREWTACLHPDDREPTRNRVVSAFGEQLENGLLHETHEFCFEWRGAPGAAGSEIWLQSWGVPLSRDGRLTGWLVTARDVTAERHLLGELGRTQRRLEKVVSTSPDFFTILRSDGSLLWTGGAGSPHLRRPAGPGIQADPESVVAKEDVPRAQRALTPLFESEPGAVSAFFEVRVRSATGTWRWVEVSGVNLIQDPDVGGIVLHSRDITEHREALQSLRALTARLEEQDTARSQFIADISHELRTPLTSVAACAELLHQDIDSDDRPALRAHLEVLERNTRRLLRCVDDLLLVDQLETRALSIDAVEVDVGLLVELAARSIRPAADREGVVIDLEVTAGPPLRGDRDRLGQLLDNLLTNAVKFTPSGGQVTLRARPEGLRWRIEVADTGVGVPPGEVERLFRQFFRGTNAREAGIPGSGLGLAIAQRIAQLHGGSITVTSELDHGSCFSVELPMRPGDDPSGT